MIERIDFGLTKKRKQCRGEILDVKEWQKMMPIQYTHIHSINIIVCVLYFQLVYLLLFLWVLTQTVMDELLT